MNVSARLQNLGGGVRKRPKRILEFRSPDAPLKKSKIEHRISPRTAFGTKDEIIKVNPPNNQFV